MNRSEPHTPGPGAHTRAHRDHGGHLTRPGAISPDPRERVPPPLESVAPASSATGSSCAPESCNSQGGAAPWPRRTLLLSTVPQSRDRSRSSAAARGSGGDRSPDRAPLSHPRAPTRPKGPTPRLPETAAPMSKSKSCVSPVVNRQQFRKSSLRALHPVHSAGRAVSTRFPQGTVRTTRAPYPARRGRSAPGSPRAASRPGAALRSRFASAAGGTLPCADLPDRWDRPARIATSRARRQQTRAPAPARAREAGWRGALRTLQPGHPRRPARSRVFRGIYLPCVSQSESQSQTLGGGGMRVRGRAPKWWRRERDESSRAARGDAGLRGTRSAGRLRGSGGGDGGDAGRSAKSSSNTWRLRGAK